MVSSMWTGPLSKTETQRTRGSEVVMADFIRSSSGFALISSIRFFESLSALGLGCLHWLGIPLLTLAVPLVPVRGTVIVSVFPACGPAGIFAVYCPPAAAACTTGSDGYRLSHQPV
eukprot:6571298-Prymnesium_polylepis.1